MDGCLCPVKNFSRNGGDGRMREPVLFPVEVNQQNERENEVVLSDIHALVCNHLANVCKPLCLGC